jgi:hypothetical protein
MQVAFMVVGWVDLGKALTVAAKGWLVINEIVETNLNFGCHRGLARPLCSSIKGITSLTLSK